MVLPWFIEDYFLSSSECVADTFNEDNHLVTELVEEDAIETIDLGKTEEKINIDVSKIPYRAVWHIGQRQSQFP